MNSEALDLELNVARIVSRQERRGIRFDHLAAADLHGKLVDEKTGMMKELREAFPSWTEISTFIPKKNNKPRGYVVGVPFEKRTEVEFTATNRFHIAKVLREKHGWEPTEFNDDGTPTLDEETLALLPFPEVPLIARALRVEKLLGYLATGNKAWMKLMRAEHEYYVLHGSVNTLGAASRRMTHSDPNLGQVPSNDVPYGKECRALFKPRPRLRLVGCDADGLEGRCLGHRLTPYDGGAFTKTILEGRKEEGTDLHTVNARAIGLDPASKYRVGVTDLGGRDIAKTWFYAFIYGAGDEKLGHILGINGPKKEIRGRRVDALARAAGAESRDKFFKRLPALKALTAVAQQKARTVKVIRSLDGIMLPCRSFSAALNTVLQSDGAVLMKRGLVILDTKLQAAGAQPGHDYEFLLNVHDEWQIEVLPMHAEEFGKAAAESIKEAGEHYNLRCPLAGNYAIGSTWAETH